MAECQRPTFHRRRVRCYEFAYVVPWDKIIAEMDQDREESRD